MSDVASRFERTCAELTQALANFMGAVSAELLRIGSTVAPHSHPPEAQTAGPSQAVTDQPGGLPPDAMPFGDFLDVSSLQTAPAEPQKARDAPPAAFSADRIWSDERLTIVRETYPAGVALNDIADRVNAAPGKGKVARHRIGIQATKMGLRRPPKTLASTAPASEEMASTLKERWTAERLAMARPLYMSGASVVDVAAAVNRLPGEPVTAQQVSLCGAARQWTRGTRACVTQEPVPADALQIIQWAGERGIIVTTREVPMDVINARRLHLGMPPFVLTPARRRAIA